jgi:hypothetical protein
MDYISRVFPKENVCKYKYSINIKNVLEENGGYRTLLTTTLLLATQSCVL